MARARGEGSVFKNAQRGTWTAQLRINGRKRTRSVATQREAVRALAEMRRERDAGRDPSRMTVETFLARWIEHKRQQGIRSKTLVGYDTYLRNRILPALGSRVLSELTPMDVEAMTKGIAEAGLASRTAAHARTILANALHDAERWGLVSRNVAALATPPRIDAPERKALDAGQALTLLAALEGHPHEGLFMLAVLLGLRQGEALALEWGDVDLDAGTVRIARTVRRIGSQDIYEPPKSARSRRTLPLTPRLVAALRRTHAHQMTARMACYPGLWVESDLVFTGPDGRGLEHSYVLRALYRAMDRAGLPRVTFHDLRHSAASVMAAQGVPAVATAAILGHSQVSTTLDVYTHVLDGATRDAVDRIEATLAAQQMAQQVGAHS